MKKINNDTRLSGDFIWKYFDKTNIILNNPQSDYNSHYQKLSNTFLIKFWCHLSELLKTKLILDKNNGFNIQIVEELNSISKIETTPENKKYVEILKNDFYSRYKDVLGLTREIQE